MISPACSSLAQWYSKGPRGLCVRSKTSSDGILKMLETTQPAGDMSIPAVPDLFMYLDLLGGTRVCASHAGQHVHGTSQRGGVKPVAPNVAFSLKVATSHYVRSPAVSVAQWLNVLNEAIDGSFSFDDLKDVAQDVGHSSNRVLSRVFLRHMRLSPSDYSRAVRDPVRPSISLSARSSLEGLQ